MLGSSALTAETAAGGELGFAQLVLDQPETKFVVVIVVGDGDVAIGASGWGFVVEIAEWFIPKFDAVAVIELLSGETGEVGFQLGQDGAGLGVQEHRQKKIDIGCLRACHVMKMGVDAKREFLQVRFEGGQDFRIEHRELLGMAFRQNSVIKLPASRARFTADMRPFPADQVDVELLLEGI